MKVFHRWQRTTIANQLMVMTSALVAFGTLFYVGVAVFQYYLMKESGRQASEQTDRLIAATKRMADTTVDALNEAKKTNDESAKRAEKSIEISKSFAEAANRQAENSEKSAHSAEISASASAQSIQVIKSGILIANRAYIELDDKMKFLHPLEPNKPVVFVFKFVNDGNSQANLNFTATSRIDKGLQPCKYIDQYKFEGKEIIVSPKNSRTMNLLISPQGFSQPDIDAIQHGQKVFQMCLDGTYSSLDTIYKLNECVYYYPELNNFFGCPTSELKSYGDLLISPGY